MRIAINAALPPVGASGGVVQAVAGLVYGLGQLADSDYLIAVDRGKAGWLTPYLGPRQRIVTRPVSRIARLMEWAGERPALGRALRLASAPWDATVRRYLRRRHRLTVAPYPVRATGWFESLGVEAVHFPYQQLEYVRLPSIFNPWDLQHLHHPEFFTAEQLRIRQSYYPLACRAATAVEVASRSVGQEIVERFGIPPQRVFVLPWGSALELPGAEPDAATRRAVAARVGGLQPFALYPAQTYPHKNHLRLLQAVAWLRDHRGLTVRVVCPGYQNEHFPVLRAEQLRLGLEEQVVFLGFVTAAELRALYDLAEFVVFPSLHEGLGFPVIEAMRAGLPLAAARTPVIAEVAGDAALLFDPTSVEDIARALESLMTSQRLRSELRRRGRDQAARYSWRASAVAHQALYRYVAGRPLTHDERDLLASCALVL